MGKNLALLPLRDKSVEPILMEVIFVKNGYCCCLMDQTSGFVYYMDIS